MMANSVERYYQRKKKRKKRAKVVFFTLLFLLMLLTLVILSVTVFFNAEKITVEGNTHYSVEELLDQGGLSIGQNMFRMDKFEVIDRMEELPYVKEVTIRRKLPSTLTVKIVENQPVVWVATPTGVALLNEEYRVLELLELPPELRFEPEPTEEEKPTEEEPAEEEPTEEEPAEEEPTEEKPTEEKPTEEEPAEEPEEVPDENPVLERLAGIPRLTKVAATELTVGKPAVFGEEDYSGFLLAIYEAFSRSDLQWTEVNEVQFHQRYDIRVVYKERLTIDFGTLDQVETKLELAAYLIEDNGTAQTATLDVSDPERVYYRPKK